MNTAHGFCPTEKVKAIKKAKLSPVGSYTAKKLFAYNERIQVYLNLDYSKYTFISREEQVATPKENFNLTIYFSRAKKATEREDCLDVTG